MPIAKTVKGGVLVPGLELVSLYFLLSVTVLVSYISLLGCLQMAPSFDGLICHPSEERYIFSSEFGVY